MPNKEYYNTLIVNNKLKLRWCCMCDRKAKKTNYEYCAEAIDVLLKSQYIKAEVKGAFDVDGSWVEIKLTDPSIHNLEYVSKIIPKFQSTLDFERKDRVKSERSQMKVDYVAVNVKYTASMKNKVWNWLQSKFETDIGKLPAQYEQLDQYHVGRLSKVPAFELINLALLNRLKNTSFWNEA